MIIFWKRNTLFLSILLVVTFTSVSFGNPADKSPQETENPDEIVFPSHLGEVTFPHQMHWDDAEIECLSCHHEAKALTLAFPHEEYMADCAEICRRCHVEKGKKPKIQACKKCHNRQKRTAMKTVDATTIIHKNCWKCHESGKGVAAGKNCITCHSGKKK
ncbi:cytochrome c3 family protein [candidate division CSSED10-310 bacterium]|uniref:Cytochrome c3 family protein n=1 Tax=candidate division CSSED10-310 bacterium TaxID=2855610 RepID=A0ABV6Z219_UNCC1